MAEEHNYEKSLRVKGMAFFLKVRLKIVELLLSLAEKVCPHIMAGIHEDDEEHFYTVCYFCGQEEH